jgi:GNAT superfamily N-acetyltransferase
MASIRHAAAGDVDSILALTTDFAVSFVVDGAAFRSLFATILEVPDACLLVAESEDVIAGYLLAFDHPALHANGRITWVDELAVAEAHQRRGIGRELMSAIEAWSRERGNVMVSLATRRAGAFYAALGYEESAAFFRKML